MILELFVPALLAILPSYVWLLFFLKNDKNPEPNIRILATFLIGMLFAVPAFFTETGILAIVDLGSEEWPICIASIFLLKIFIAVALIEEIFKYLSVKLFAFRHQEFDEPMDAPIYMMVSALGFAAVENSLFLSAADWTKPEIPLALALIRFLGATFLHALSSALFGCFIALSFYHFKKRKRYFWTGLFLATLLHGSYNFLIIGMQSYSQFLLLFVALLGVSFLLLPFFEKIKTLKSICKLN
ncbi:MAG: PrsW family intramembrane metalloprotease [Candidatus Paceibacterota bacterium]|jgi:RsiW-degrading membrane proteinase PrsW (M82 family)